MSATLVAGLAWLALAPPTADVAAHEFRAWLWDTEGFTEWNPQWYGGHHVPGYSLLFPPLAGALGARPAIVVAGVLAAATVAALTARPEKLALSARNSGPGVRAAVMWLAVAGVAASLVVGRGPFLLGVAFGALALMNRRWAPAAALATVCASPVAGLFLLVCACALPAKRAITIGFPVLVGGATIALLWPEGGEERFVATAFLPLFALTATATALVKAPGIRRAGLVYLSMLLFAFLIPEPVGQNAARLAVLAGPAALLACARPTRGVVLVVLALVYLQWLPAVRAVSEAAGDPSTRASYFEPLVQRLPEGARTEVVFTRNHFEAAYVARHVPLARGWLRQLDITRNRLFYEPGLTAETYERWLRDKQIRFVALPDAPLDFSARDEARVVSSDPPYLRQVWSSPDWRVFEVTPRR